MIDKIKIGDFLRKLRNEKGLTQEELAEKYGVSSRSVSRWENGNTMPELGILVELADYYEVDIKEIIDGERKSEIVEKQEKETLLKAAEYAKEERKYAIRKSIAILTGVVMFVFAILLFFILDIPENVALHIDSISVGVSVIGLTALWMMVMNGNKKNKA